jgi:hypothetical protein
MEINANVILKATKVDGIYDGRSSAGRGSGAGSRWRRSP